MLHLTLLTHTDDEYSSWGIPAIYLSAIQLWNTLPVDICQLSPYGFKTHLSSFRFDHRTTSCFYRAMLCIRGTSHGPVSVCLSVSVRLCPSVTSQSSTKTAKRRITQTTPHDRSGTLVFWCQRSPRNSTGVTPYEGAECRWGGSKSATFDQ